MAQGETTQLEQLEELKGRVVGFSEAAADVVADVRNMLEYKVLGSTDYENQVTLGENTIAIDVPEGTPVDEIASRVAQFISTLSQLVGALPVPAPNVPKPQPETTPYVPKGVFDRHYKEAFGDPPDYHQSEMHHAVKRLFEMIESDPKYYDAWADVWRRAASFEKMNRFKPEIASLPSDSQRIVDLMENVTTCAGLFTRLADSLKSHFETGTFRELGNSRAVEREMIAYVNKEPSQLPELARHFRAVLDIKVMQNAAREIGKEREKRLMKAFGLRNTFEVTPTHRSSYYRYDSVLFSQIELYLEGDRSNAVFDIGPRVS